MVNREKKMRERIEGNIKVEKWVKYFKGLLGGVEKRRKRGRRKVREGDRELEITRGEVKRVIGRLREGKAVGKDGIPGEIWKYRGEKVKRFI